MSYYNEIWNRIYDMASLIDQGLYDDFPEMCIEINGKFYLDIDGN